MWRRMMPGTLAAPLDEPRILEITARGQLDNLQYRRASRRPPGRGEVELRVHATGLNFRDVLNALGMYPGDPGPLGNECAGIVTAVGEGVQQLDVGDEVISMVDRSFATYVTAPAALTVRKPAEISFVEAATVPVAFLTATYALHDSRPHPQRRPRAHSRGHGRRGHGGRPDRHASQALRSSAPPGRPPSANSRVRSACITSPIRARSASRPKCSG